MKKKCILCGEVLSDEAIFTLDNAPIGAQHMPETINLYGGG